MNVFSGKKIIQKNFHRSFYGGLFLYAVLYTIYKINSKMYVGLIASFSLTLYFLSYRITIQNKTSDSVCIPTAQFRTWQL